MIAETGLEQECDLINTQECGLINMCVLLIWQKYRTVGDLQLNNGPGNYNK